MKTVVMLAAMALAFFAHEAGAGFYKWTDSDGKENYTNDPAKVPPEYRDRTTPVEPSGERVSVGREPVAPRYTTPAADEHRDKHGRGEEYWRRRAANLRLKLRDLQDEYDMVLKQEQDQDRKPHKLSGKKKKSNSSIEKKKMKLEKEIAQLKRKLEVDLPEEARKADAYPGWIRE